MVTAPPDSRLWLLRVTIPWSSQQDLYQSGRGYTTTIMTAWRDSNHGDPKWLDQSRGGPGRDEILSVTESAQWQAAADRNPKQGVHRGPRTITAVNANSPPGEAKLLDRLSFSVSPITLNEHAPVTVCHRRITCHALVTSVQLKTETPLPGHTCVALLQSVTIHATLRVTQGLYLSQRPGTVCAFHISSS